MLWRFNVGVASRACLRAPLENRLVGPSAGRVSGAWYLAASRFVDRSGSHESLLLDPGGPIGWRNAFVRAPPEP